MGDITIQGEIYSIGEITKFSANGFQDRKIVIQTEDDYPQYIEIVFTQEKCSIPDSVYIGQKVKVQSNLRGRRWINPSGTEQIFNSIHGRTITKI